MATQYDKTILPDLHPKAEGTEQDHRPCEDSLKYANFYEQRNQDTSVPLQPVCASAEYVDARGAEMTVQINPPDHGHCITGQHPKHIAKQLRQRTSHDRSEEHTSELQSR